MSGKCSPRLAIKAQCAECVAFDRDAIRDCTEFDCGLWNLRPFKQLCPSPGEKIAAKRAGRLATALRSWKGILKRSWSPKCSPRAAVKAFCGVCNGYDRDSIRGCACWACPLWNFRPYQKP
jgi:hypothetical protein